MKKMHPAAVRAAKRAKRNREAARKFGRAFRRFIPHLERLQALGNPFEGPFFSITVPPFNGRTFADQIAGSLAEVSAAALSAGPAMIGLSEAVTRMMQGLPKAARLRAAGTVPPDPTDPGNPYGQHTAHWCIIDERPTLPTQ